MIHLAIYQPDIPQNLGTMLRLVSCMDIKAHIIEPCSFPFSSRQLRRAGMDYLDQVDYIAHSSWDTFLAWKNELLPQGRIVLLTTKTQNRYVDFSFAANDILLVGKESAGVPETVSQTADHSITIPMAPHNRSLNVAISAAMVLGEALRQTDLLPKQPLST